MTAFLHDVARAALPVAIGLLTCAAAARAVLWSGFDDAQAQRLARQYLAPLCTWSLIALGTHVLALGAAGEASVLSLLLPLSLGAAAVLLRTAPERDTEAATAEPAPRRATAPRPATPAPSRTRTRTAPEAKAPAPAAAPTAARAAAPAARTAPAPAPAGRLWADPTEDEAAGRSGLWSRA
jgi:hypothetical protein